MYTLIIEMFPLESRGTIAAIAALYWAVAVVFFAGFAFFLRNFAWRTLQLVSGSLAFHSVVSYW